MKRLVIGPHISEHAGPDQWLEHVKGLKITAPSNASKAVPDVTISWGKKVIVRIARPVKQLTEQEVAALAAEYGQPVGGLVDILTKRKIRIVNAEGEQVNVKPARKRTGRPAGSGRKKKKEDAGSEQARGQDPGGHQLQQPGTDPDLSPQGVL